MKPRGPKLALAILLWVVLASVAGCNLSSHSTDRALEATLRSHQGDFDRLIGMLSEDQDIVRLDSKFVFLSDNSNRNISNERLEVYRSLFRKLGLQGGFHRDNHNALRLIASSGVSFTGRSEKSYVYCIDELTPLVDSLDHVVEMDRGDQKPVYKKLHRGWYLYYESW